MLQHTFSEVTVKTITKDGHASAVADHVISIGHNIKWCRGISANLNCRNW